jgi:hypothetical protein
MHRVRRLCIPDGTAPARWTLIEALQLARAVRFRTQGTLSFEVEIFINAGLLRHLAGFNVPNYYWIDRCPGTTRALDSGTCATIRQERPC